MKRVRFSLRTLIIFVSIVAFVVWWVTWPERTIEQFVKLFGTDKFDEMSRLMATQEDREFVAFMKKMHELEQRSGEQPEVLVDGPTRQLEQVERSWSDVFLGRAFFYERDAGFYVQRGRVSFETFDPEP